MGNSETPMRYVSDCDQCKAIMVLPLRDIVRNDGLFSCPSCGQPYKVDRTAVPDIVAAVQAERAGKKQEWLEAHPDLWDRRV